VLEAHLRSRHGCEPVFKLENLITLNHPQCDTLT
jgi:hypothetical protein